MQRLFTMFPSGWPGIGLLILRLVNGAFLIQDGAASVTGAPHLQPTIVLLLLAIAGILLIVGFWTPVAGVVVAVAELSIAVSGTDNLRSTLGLAGSGISIAVLGPGSWSIDALLFGRQRLDLRGR